MTPLNRVILGRVACERILGSPLALMFGGPISGLFEELILWRRHYGRCESTAYLKT
jgi:hypothetical protein